MTSRPVPIPTARSFAAPSSRPVRRHEERGPYFGLIDILENGEASWLLSDGSGKFVQLKSCEPVPQLVFIIEKRRTTRHLIVEILTPTLKRIVRGALGRTDIPGSPLELDVTTLLTHYGLLKSQIETLQQKKLSQRETIELKLLLRGCLLDESIHHGADTAIRRTFTCPASSAYLQDVLHHKLLLGFDELDDCFRLGLLSEEAAALEVSAFNHRFEQLAYAGNLYALQEHVEPAVRSGEVEVQHDDAFLANVLASGHSATHQYLMDLSQRTLSSNLHQSALEGRDVSADPMYEAIKQGQLQAVRLCVLNRHSFSGFIYQDQDQPQLPYVTPLVAAVIWEQHDILRLLLEVGNPYLNGWAHALSWATTCSSAETLSILRDFESHNIGSLHRSESVLSQQPGMGSLANHMEMSPQSHQLSQRASREPSRSVSEIANRIAGLGWDEGFRRFDQLSVFSSGASTPTPITSSWTADTMRSSSQASAFPAYHIVQPSSAQSCRMKIGKDIVSKLENTCERLRTFLANSPWENQIVIPCFTSAKHVWQVGLECARQLLRNKAPTSVTEVIQLLLVVDALDSDATEGSYGIKARDNDRWRAAISPQEQSMFDTLVQVAFGESSSLSWSPSSDINELWRVQELAQNLVSVCSQENGSVDVPTIRGLRLSFIYGCHHAWRKSDEQRKQQLANSSCHYPVGTTQESFGLDSWREWADGEEFDLFDFIKVDAVQEEQVRSRPNDRGTRPEEDATWKSIAPTVVLLLGSQEFSKILYAIKRVQLPNEGSLSPSTRQRASTGKRPRALDRLEEFCSLAQRFATGDIIERTLATLDGSYVSLIPTMKAWIQGSFASEDKLSQSLDPYFLQCGADSRALSTEDMVVASSLSSSVPSNRPSKPLDRLRCQSLGCPKTFSNVSNRNKHMREGCAFRENPGYRCRNEGCSKTLTTKWYRSTHETTRCRYRAVMVGQGSPPVSEDSLMGGVPGG